MYNLHEAYLDVYEEVDKRRAPKELLDRLKDSSEGWMPQDGPNRPAYEAKQRLLRKAWERRNQKEEVDIYDIILSYLLDEGYADTEQAAEKIMLVMSEEWVNNILNESDSAENEEKERTRNNSTQLSRVRREIQQLTAQGKQVPMELHTQATELGRQVRLASNAGAVLNKDKPKPRTVPGRGEKTQKERDVVSGLSSSDFRGALADHTTRNIINKIPENPNRPARTSTHMTSSGEVRPNISQDTSSGIDRSRYTDDRNQRQRPARQRTQQRGLTASDPNRPITTRNQTN